MTWRVVSISSRAKLDFRMGYLEVRQMDSLKRIHLSEISTLLIESEAVSITTYLLNELINRKINVVLCDEKHLPNAYFLPYAGASDSSSQVLQQTKWKQNTKDLVWQMIIREKINNQSSVLRYLGIDLEADLLDQYSTQVELGDSTNREGFSAKVYFNRILGEDFSRRIESYANSALNYGYAILMSSFARAVTSNGCFNQIGIWHHGATNNFNFSCDLMEPFRPIVDFVVIQNKFFKFETEEKRILKNILNEEFVFEDKRQYLNNIIQSYTKSVIDALNTDDITNKKIFLL